MSSLFAGQLLRGDLAGRPVLVGVLDLGPDGARLVLLALVHVQIRQVKLGHAGGHRRGGLCDQLVVKLDGLRIASRLVIEARQRQLGQAGQVRIPCACRRLQLRLRRGGLPELLVRW